MSADLHGDEAERTIPPSTRGIVELLRNRGHTVSVRRSARNGSWYYTVNGQREIRGGQLNSRFIRGYYSQ